MEKTVNIKLGTQGYLSATHAPLPRGRGNLLIAFSQNDTIKELKLHSLCRLNGVESQVSIALHAINYTCC